MRVRKSVADGYKTDPSSYSAFALWSESDGKTADTTPVLSTYSGGGLRNELVPYSGINKIGGMAVQPQIQRDFVTSSLESVSSTTSAMEVMEKTKKRGFIGDEEENEEREMHDGMWRTRQEWIDGEISPRSFAPAGWGNARVLAVPKSRVKGQKVVSQAEVGQENLDDFEEATFLEAMEDE